MALFSSDNLFIRFLLRLFFQSWLYALSLRLVKRIPVRPLAFRMLDYMTYYLVYEGLRKIRLNATCSSSR
jgi:hypothetical protein